jgi:hypothetical protein
VVKAALEFYLTVLITQVAEEAVGLTPLHLQVKVVLAVAGLAVWLLMVEQNYHQQLLVLMELEAAEAVAVALRMVHAEEVALLLLNTQIHNVQQLQQLAHQL